MFGGIHMAEERNSRSSGVDFLLSVASYGAGAYHGYCDAQGIPLTQNLEKTLTYAPLLVRGTLGMITGGLVGIIGGGVVGGVAGAEASEKLQQKVQSLSALAGAGAGSAVGGCAGAAVGGGICAAQGAIQTLLGYTGGYIVGLMLK